MNEGYIVENINAFEVHVLDADALAKVSGGLLATQDTQSACHVDGTNDNEDGTHTN